MLSASYDEWVANGRIHHQPAGQPVLIGKWDTHDQFGVHPVGSKPKSTLICPKVAAEPFLIPGHFYLFKWASGWRRMQTWSEVIAFRIAQLVGVDVPPAFIAINEDTGDVGVLIEFFYGHPGQVPPARLLHAADILQRMKASGKTGRPHGARTNVAVCKAYKVGSEAIWWGRVLTFDALIGNTDRHSENWGLLTELRKGAAPVYRFAPAFDNGTSLAYEVPEERLANFKDANVLSEYVGRGRHNCGWDSGDDAQAGHFALVERFAAHFPEAVDAMRGVIDFDTIALTALVTDCCAFDVSIRLSEGRAEFLVSLVEARRMSLRAVLGG